MHDRRKFLLQSTLAAGSLVLSNPLKTIASPPSCRPRALKKVNILNLHSLQNLPSKFISTLSAGTLARFFSKGDENSVLLSTGNLVKTNSTSKIADLEMLKSLKKAGCDAIVLQRKDKQNGLSYFKEVANESRLTSLSEISNTVDSDDPLPYHIVFKQNIKVGIIGNALNQQESVTDNIDEIAARLNKTAEYLKAKAMCHLIVAMNPCTTTSECSKREEKAIAAQTKNIDVIVSSNSNLKHPTTYVVKNIERDEVVLNYQGTEGGHLKNVEICFNDKMEKVSLSLRRVV